MIVIMMMNLACRFCLLFCFVALALLCSSNAGAQTKHTSQAKQSPTVPVALLTIGGEVARPLKLTTADIAKLPRRTLRTFDHGKEATFEGVPLVEVLRLAGVKFGEELRGKNLELYLLVEAADGYKAVFALPELDPAFTERVIILADRRDGKPLSVEEGQWRVVTPGEKRQGRWVRQVVALTVKRVQ